MQWNVIQPLKRNEVVIATTAWISPENITLSARNQ